MTTANSPTDFDAELLYKRCDTKRFVGLDSDVGVYVSNR